MHVRLFKIISIMIFSINLNAYPIIQKDHTWWMQKMIELKEKPDNLSQNVITEEVKKIQALTDEEIFNLNPYQFTYYLECIDMLKSTVSAADSEKYRKLYDKLQDTRTLMMLYQSRDQIKNYTDLFLANLDTTTFNNYLGGMGSIIDSKKASNKDKEKAVEQLKRLATSFAMKNRIGRMSDSPYISYDSEIEDRFSEFTPSPYWYKINQTLNN